MLTAAMLAMVLAAGVPALAQTGAAAQYQYIAAADLPSTGGPSLIALGAGVLLVAGGLLARRIVR